MIKLHHLEQSRSRRILWLLEELGLEYERVDYARDPATRRAPPELKAVHPLGKSPVLEDEGVILAESGAIAEYLVNRHAGGRLAPAPDDASYPDYLFWFHFAEGMGAFTLIVGVLLEVTGADAPVLKDQVGAEAERLVDFIEARLSTSAYLAGEEFTAADVMSSFVLEMAAGRGLLEGKQHSLDYLARLQARPAHERASRT